MDERIEAIKVEREDLREIWINEGCRYPFSYWLMERIERSLRLGNEAIYQGQKEALAESIYNTPLHEG